MSRRCDGTCDTCSEDCFYGGDDANRCDMCGAVIYDGDGPLAEDEDGGLLCVTCTKGAIECGAAWPNPEATP